ncbi:MAG: VWA domain-containing protein [Myxococcota bacterium]|nr:VWA domain-containing protein [Myxococcota bacterium]
MSGFRFAEPGWVHALWVVVAYAALLLWLETRGGRALDRFVSPALQARLVRRPSPLRRRLRLLLLGLCLASLVVALMRPQWGFRSVSTRRVGAQLMIALDVSRSMLAEDVAPNRLERAKAEILDLLTYLEGDQVGLVAFAGRASVVSPLTPDFGFLRLVLETLGPNSAGRGGTRLEEPIRKALDGFAEDSGVSQAILLITDGEDHDSFPLEAARAAAERGVRLVAIGFGDEAGAPIPLTDPRTGARTLLRDANGAVVQSRLDGDLLREIALATGGAYVPAGSGVLDLESIYREHIERLTRAPQESSSQVVRNEGFQWAVLLALAFLLASAALTGRAERVELVRRLRHLLPGLRAGLLVLALGVGGAPAARAQPGPPEEPLLEEAAGAEAEVQVEPEREPELEIPEPPRESYNAGLEQMAEREWEAAERLLAAARGAARDDGELRYRATYNLGWLAVQRADELIESEPDEALRWLHVAIDRFREAVRVRPDASDARQNLELTLRRALVLEDSLAQQGEADLASALQELADQQRALLTDARRSVQRLAESSDPNAADAPGLRGEFRSLAARQRRILSDADRLAERAAQERATLEAKAPEERGPEDGMRSAQLGNLLHYLHRARERLGHARRELRQRRGERGFRRASAALGELKRAQDQLRDPVQVLDALITDATEQARYTVARAALEGSLPLPEERRPEPPAWLTPKLLLETQQGLAERTGELHARLEAGLTQAGAASQSDPQAERTLARVREAEPFVRSGSEAMADAVAPLEAGRTPEALEAQQQALRALLEARERFLDLRRLIESAHAAQTQIGAGLAVEEAARAARLPRLAEAQIGNLERAGRIEQQIAEERATLEAGAAAPDADPQALEGQRQRLELADGLLAGAQAAMRTTRDELVAAAGEAPEGEPAEAAREASERALARLEALRRLFFSVVEHLQELARRQLELGDETEAAAGGQLGDLEALAAELVRLGDAQRQRAADAESIAQSLLAQSRADPAQAGVPPDAMQQAAEAQQRFARASDHVTVAREAMDRAAGGMQADAATPRLDPVRADQNEALTELAAALELLAPPPPQSGDSQQQQQEQQQGESGEQGARRPQARSDPSQTLQGVRDREAQRRRERAQQAPGPGDTVEKDW